MEHNWNLTPTEAIALQKQLRSEVRIEKFGKEIKYIAGADVSLNRFYTTLYAGIIVLKFPELTPVDHSVIKIETKFPYIPGLLSFREIPGLLLAFEKLKIKPDLIMVDGHGIAHPRRIGIATHLGLAIDVPTIGCAKSVLTGKFSEPVRAAGNFSYLYDKEEIIGAAVRSKANCKPLIISPGHRITLDESIGIVLQCVKNYRMPEPTRQAHNLVNDFRRADLGTLTQPTLEF